MFVLAVPAALLPVDAFAVVVVVVLSALLQLPGLCATEMLSNANAVLHEMALASSDCTSPPMALGMESGELPDQWLFASSSFHPHSLGPHNARIRTEEGGGAWCPREQIKADSYEFIQVLLQSTKVTELVDFPSLHVISGIEVQGRHANGSGREWAEALVVDFLRERWDRGTNWTRYENDKQEQILLANRDPANAVLIPLNPPLSAVSVRLVPFSAQLRTVCLRFELYGCVAVNGEGKARGGVVLQNADESGGGAVLVLSLLPLPLLLLLVPPSVVLFLLLLLGLFRSVRSLLRRAISPDKKGLFGGTSSAGGSPPLLPSSSWQNVRLPFDTSNAKVFSPSFCRFDTVSLGWPPSLVSSSPALPGTDNWAEEPQRSIYCADNNEQRNGEEAAGRQNEVTRSRSLHAAGRIGTPMPQQTAATAKVPVRPVRVCQLAHSCSQPESFRAVARPLLCQRLPKPVPKPRRAVPNFTGRI